MRKCKAMIKAFALCLILSICQANTLICHEKEKQALLSFKHALADPTNRLLSWSPNEDCCGWTGIRCDNMSGQVVGIHLGNWNDPDATGPYGILGGEISPALLDLQFLKHLDLSFNDFGGNPIPTFLGSMQSLSVLYLFDASFGGIIPPQLGNLSGLHHLALGCSPAFVCKLRMENFSWISHLLSLETLSIQGIDLRKEVHWLEYVSALPSLSSLNLIQCQLYSMSPSRAYVNFTSLSSISLPFNNFNHELPNWLFNLRTNIIALDLMGNSFRGQIPSTISSLHTLAYLDLSQNHLVGQIPPEIGNLSSLHYLALGCSGTLRCELHFENFSWISRLSSLETLVIQGIDLRKEVHWLEYVSALPSLSSLNLMQCQLYSMSPSRAYVNFTSLSYISLRFNNFNHELPNWLFNLRTNIIALDLMGNSFRGQIPSTISSLHTLAYLDLSQNHLVGQIPPEIGNLSSLHYLALGCSGTLRCELHFENFSWISRLSSLETLVIQGIDLRKEVRWLEYVSVLPSLSILSITQCQLDNMSPSLDYVNFTSLSQLYLPLNNFSHELPTWLFNLRSKLSRLNLRGNSFRGRIPSTISNLDTLVYLDLSYNRLVGQIPPQVGNLSSLQYLALGCSDALSCELYVENFSWIARLSSLETLLLTGIDLHKEGRWLKYVSTLPLLSGLYMAYCQLDNMSPSLEHVNFTSLSSLHLSFNNFNHELPNWLFNLSNLMYMDLSGNSLRGQIPSTISNLHNLFFMNLSDNHLKGPIPESLGQLKNLADLHLGHNSLDGLIPSSIGNLSSLVTLNLRDNHLNGTLPVSTGLLSRLDNLIIAGNPMSGTVSEAHFSKLSNLATLIMSSTNLTLSVSANWIPPFQLKILIPCKMGPRFPAWLQTQTSLQILIMLNSGIEDTAPSWFWKWATQISLILDLSGNMMAGDLSNVLLNTTEVDLSSNRFTGHLPRLSANVMELRIAGNSFSGHISSFLCRTGSDRSKLKVMDLSNNSLSGELVPQCLRYWPSLTHLDLGNNNLSGTIPHSIGSLPALKALHLSNNTFFGEIPASLKNCTFLGLLDLAENKLSGKIPSWIGEMSNLLALCLRSNKFVSNVPPQICKLSSLIVLDLANNTLSGAIPKCINNFSTMARVDNEFDDGFTTVFPIDGFDYQDPSQVAQGPIFPYLLALAAKQRKLEYLSLVVKGRKSKYDSILALVRTIDFSSNSLSGPIPTEISSLSLLLFLNLSRNHLTGTIPEKVGSMKSLESLDLSRNHLSGAVPESITNLSFLDQLDLSYNNLSGRIPSSTQLQSFAAECFIGNAELCGPPLTVNCTKKEDLDDINRIEERREDYEMIWFYMGMASGFILSFWGVFGVLILKREWRHAYFRFLDDTRHQLYVVTVPKMVWLRKHLRRHPRGPRCLRGRSQEGRGERESGGS